MNWDSWGALWAMGGDGIYVWGAYLVALVVAATEIGILALSRRAILAHLGRFARIRPATSDTEAGRRSPLIFPRTERVGGASANGAAVRHRR